MSRPDSDLASLRKLARQLGAERKEAPSTVHLLAAVHRAGGPARGLLDERRIDEARLLGTVRAFDEQVSDAISHALADARQVAQRAAVPTRGSFRSTRGEGARPAAAEAPSGLHVLAALLSNRRFAAYRALVHCGVDVAKLRAAVTRILLGVVSPPRERRDADELGSARRAAQRAAAPPPPTEQPAPKRPARLRGRGRAVQVPLIPVRRAPSADVEAIETQHALALDAARYPTLAQLGQNLTLAAVQGELDVVVGRDDEIEQALDVLAKRHANNPLLVGRPGVGKTSVARGIAARFSSDDEPRLLIELSVSDLVAGTNARGSLAERLTAIKNEVKAAGSRIVLFIDELHELIGAADEAMGELKLAMARGELPVIACAGTDEYKRLCENEPALARRFSAVEIEEPNETDAFLLLRVVSEALAAHHHVSYSDEAIAATVSWSIRFLPARALPDKAVGILDLAGARRSRRKREGERAEVLPEHVADILSELCDVPRERLLETDRQRLLALEGLLCERVVGHREACERMAAVLRRNAAGLRVSRPIGSFLLLGPTGVGKTESAKALAEVLFGSPDAMTRLDMSEYAEPHAVARLIGAPPGYVGHEAGGLLTEAVRRRPYQVVLLDEIEKAHRDVLQTFLQVFDEGRLTDGRGRTVDFRHTLIILTSNLGAQELSNALNERRVGFGAAERGPKDATMLRDVAVRAARAVLSPELYNRIDEVIYFRHLEREDIRDIAGRLLDALAASLRRQGIELDVDQAALDVLLERGGFDPELGARPMRRAIARLVEAPIADLILSGELEEGSIALVLAEDGDIVIDAVKRARRTA